MTQIPADIMEKAFEIVKAMSSNKHDALTAGDSRYANMLTDDANAVAMAIIAERERCAEVARTLLSTERKDNGACAYYANVERAILKGNAP